MFDQNPLVSIIVRTKDRPKLLNRAILSIGEQTYRPIEVVLVNDGGCEIDINEIKSILDDISLTYIRLEKNTGRAHAGNVGIENVQGNLIGFLDDDDVFYPHHVQTLVDSLQENDYKIAYTDAEIVYLSAIVKDMEIQEIGSSPRESIDFSFDTLLLHNYISFMTLLFDRDVLLEIDKFDEDFDLCEDWDLLIRLASRFPFKHIRNITARYTFWSKDKQVTIGDEKLQPYRLKILSTHREKITPQTLYTLAYEGKFFGDVKIVEKNILLERNIAEYEQSIGNIRAEKVKLDLEKKQLEYKIKNLEFKKGQLEADLLSRDDQLRKFTDSTFYSLWNLSSHVSRYYAISRQVIRHEGWTSFFAKAKRKIIKVTMPSMDEEQGKQPHLKPRFPTPRKFKIAFIVNPNEFLSNHYRAYNMHEYLNSLPIENEVIQEPDLNFQHLSTFDIIVLVRVVTSLHIEKVIDMCNIINIPVIYDIDDYLLHPSIVEHMAALEKVSEDEKQLHRKGMQLFRRAFDSADFFTAPTDYLAQVGRNFGKSSFVLRNGLNASQIELCEHILNTKVASHNDPPDVKIGYFSGTKTHQRDFAVAVPAILRIMEEFSYVFLYIGGYLDIDERFEKFTSRIKRFPFVDREKMFDNLAEIDVNIVPLEVNNPFCESKSELKYFDAALLKIPTVASPTDACKWAIRNGSNGYLASSTDEWYTYLKKLIQDPELRKMIGHRAHEHAKENYSTNPMASSANTTYKAIISEYRQIMGVLEKALKISFVVPAPAEGSGGHNKILTAAKYLTEFGHLVTLYFLKDEHFNSQEDLKNFINTSFFDPGCEIILGTDNILSCDALCATSWITAYIVKDNIHKTAKPFYFVQDFECLFFPMSDGYLQAENTYRLNFHHISFGPWCAKLLADRYYAKTDFIPFSLDRKMYYPRTMKKGKPENVIFFARPEMPRRCFNLGIEALSLFHKKYPEVKIRLFGSKEISKHPIPFTHENLGVLKKEELANLYSNADVGVAFSTTNPSMVPFEMMACGCPVIDLDYQDNYINYGSRENVKLVGTSPQEIADGIEQMIHDDVMRQQIAEKGLHFVEDFPDDRKTFMIMEEIFLQSFMKKDSPIFQTNVGNPVSQFSEI